MKPCSLLLFAVTFLFSFVAASAQAGKVPPGDNDSAIALRAETDLIKEARDAAKRDDDVGVGAKLSSASSAKLNLAPSVALVRRTAAVCGWLRNDNEYARAAKLARKAIADVANIRELTPADRVERCYWEAMLEGEILGRKQRAVELLREAVRLAPSNQRVRAEERRWSTALAEFGK